MNYDHEKNLIEARRREERREAAIGAFAFLLYAGACAGLGFAAHGPARALLFVLAGLFVVGALWLAGRWMWDEGDWP